MAKRKQKVCANRGARKDKKEYVHTAYWYATKYGWTASDATTYTQKYLDDVFYGLAGRRSWSGKCYVEPEVLATYMVADWAVEVGGKIKETIQDPAKRAEMLDRLRRTYMRIRRPFYYAREAARRAALMEERRKIRRRTTLSPMPTPEEVRKAWEARGKSKAAKIILGGMLHDLECYVDNRLRLDESGKIVGRNHGIKGWIKENLSDLLPHYKALMYYKELAMKLRQATETRDPTPTAALLPEAVLSSANVPLPGNVLSSNVHSSNVLLPGNVLSSNVLSPDVLSSNVLSPDVLSSANAPGSTDFSRISEQGEISESGKNSGQEAKSSNLAAFRNKAKMNEFKADAVVSGKSAEDEKCAEDGKSAVVRERVAENVGLGAERREEACGWKVKASGRKIHAVVSDIFEDPQCTAVSIIKILDYYLSPREVFAKKPVGALPRA